MPFLEPVTLQGQHATLVPLSQDHCGNLIEAVKDGALWTLWYTVIPSPATMADEITRRLASQAEGRMLPFAVIVGGKAVGMTTYLDADAANRRVEIGATWYRTAVQRSAVNTECKLMLLSHAFERMDCIAVEFRTHILNQQSRRAIERLGAKCDGILRNHRIMPNGTLRDTVVYSIIANEWPAVKSHLMGMLGRSRSG